MSDPLGDAADSFALNIGKRIRYFRGLRGLSLSELSRQSSIAKGTLSRLESGQGNPTIMTLASLALVLDVTPSDFIQSMPGSSTSDARSLAGPGLQMLFIHRTVSNAVWELYETTIPALKEPIVSKTHRGVEHLLMLDGEAEVGPINGPVWIKSGQHTSFAGDVPHLYWSPKGPSRLYLMMEYPLSESSQDDKP
ncbi:XRE family transcriptional regulator [Limibacillus halophilus]|uniref:Transcriptional regulator with XRE-family HTH domain n=1 Tax=Limibacillus halophilus TaxID=1579333 RepID=A0A839SUZ9_9PROT|nr:XRE family transcriptional regulator [Limibacillus halophilus]MBB3066148.1 transcriptional regulator with XRE-family HTH domain [Limibacillus halophilus]